ncbi:MAG: hypothetical protein OXC95_12535 [Dehalococcoidia bacterium]|nr:hypothetical protein [Dehalococcoidia bacterium]
MRKLVRYSKRHYWQTVAGSVILPGALAGVAEYALTQGVSGLIPILAAVIGGILTMVSLTFIQPTQEYDDDANTESREISRRSATHSSANSESSTSGGTSEVPIRPVIIEKSSHSVEGKFFSPRTPNELVDEVKGMTDVVATRVSARHIGQWLKVDGPIEDVSTEVREICVQILETEPSFFLYFDESSWSTRLASFNVGDQISVIGKIRRIGRFGYVTLEECELVT